MTLFNTISGRILFFIFVVLCFFSCTQKPVPIVDNSHKFYSKSKKFSVDEHNLSKLPQIIIEEGDNLYQLSKKHSVNLGELIKLNNLSPPYNLIAGSKLNLPIGKFHKVKEGDTLYEISRSYNMSVDELIKINNLQKPYKVVAGSMIKITDDPRNNAKSKESLTDKNPDSGFVTKELGDVNKFSWPIQGEVISDFGSKGEGLYNDGINIQAAEGSPVKSAESGVVAYSGNELRGYGNLIIIKHNSGWITAYAHLKSSNVNKGQKVNKGELIGLVGSTGNVQSPQLYFGLRKGRDAVNPKSYLR